MQPIRDSLRTETTATALVQNHFSRSLVKIMITSTQCRLTNTARCGRPQIVAQSDSFSINPWSWSRQVAYRKNMKIKCPRSCGYEEYYWSIVRFFVRWVPDSSHRSLLQCHECRAWRHKSPCCNTEQFHHHLNIPTLDSAADSRPAGSCIMASYTQLVSRSRGVDWSRLRGRNCLCSRVYSHRLKGAKGDKRWYIWEVVTL